MGTGANTAQIGTYGNTGGATIGSGGGSLTTYGAGSPSYTGNMGPYQPSQRNYDAYMPPETGGGFLEDLSVGEQYGIAAGAEAISKGIAAFSKSRAEKHSYEWKAEIYRRNALLKQRQIDDMKKVGKEKEAELLRKYKLLKIKAKPGGRKSTNILAGAGSALDILMGVDIIEAADMGVLRTNVQKDIYSGKVGKWSDDTSAAMYAHRAALSSPVGDTATSMLASAASSGMKYWKYKTSIPSAPRWSTT